MKRNSMVQWMNLHWNNSFVNWTRLPLLCEKSGTILLVLVVLWQAGRQLDEILVDLKKLKFSTDHIFRIFTEFKEDKVLYYSIEFQSFFG